jgi:hypothetical protein
MTLRFYTSGAYTEHYLGMRWPKAIWAAVLEQAIRDIVGGPDAYELKGLAPEAAEALRGDLRAAAERWVADEENEPRRFVWVCEQLGVSPDAVRRSIEARRAA